MMAWTVLGCAEKAPPSAGEAVQITPGMEKMKEEMIRSFNAANKGKPRFKVTTTAPATK